MEKKVLILPSILSADPSGLTKEIMSVIGEGGADGIHFDYMRPPFVPNSTIFDPLLVGSLRRSLSTDHVNDLFFDVHIMSNNPDELLEEFFRAGADLITVHYEIRSDLRQTLKQIKLFGKKAGVALKPETPVANIKEYIEIMDLLLIMTVNPGRSGQSLIKSCLDKVEEAAKLIENKAPNVLLQVDGGINLDNIKMAADRGATVFVSGNTVFKSSDRLRAIYAMRERALS